ncbi:MAG: hypothetical protein GX130_09220 [Candidatus Hydrogenedens sp.]|nr:hypothetical protein [Candidatus Hydrogenedens sp.]
MTKDFKAVFKNKCEKPDFCRLPEYINVNLLKNFTDQRVFVTNKQKVLEILKDVESHFRERQLSHWPTARDYQQSMLIWLRHDGGGWGLVI